MKRKRMWSIFLSCLLFLGLFPANALAAPEWPVCVALQSEAGIVMDANTGAILYGQDIHEKHFPASITKVLTGLIVLEHCSLDETVTFSQNAVYNVESNSSSAGLDTDDQLSVKDCLYAMLLKSANEAANALAEHVSGSTEEFAKLMNEKARELGCMDSNFMNPSGLNDENHYISAYDMALITKAAFENETFSQIVATTYYELPSTSRSPEGQGISPGNEMIKKNSSYYYKDVIGGKTGYTSLAGNTLVTCAKRGDMKVVTVVLKSNFKHYEDTKVLLDFAFNNFQNLKAAEYDTNYSASQNDLTISGLSIIGGSDIHLDKSSLITLPADAVFSDTVSSISYDLDGPHPDNAIARIDYTYNERDVGQAYLMLDTAAAKRISLPPSLISPTADTVSDPGQPSDPSGQAADIPDATGAEEDPGANSSPDRQAVTQTYAPDPNDSTTASRQTEPTEDEPGGRDSFSLPIPSIVWKVLLGIVAVAAAAGGGVALFLYRKRKEEEARMLRHQKRMQRLQESGYSVSEFDLLMEKKRSSYTAKPSRSGRRIHNKKR